MIAYVDPVPDLLKARPCVAVLLIIVSACARPVTPPSACADSPTEGAACSGTSTCTAPLGAAVEVCTCTNDRWSCVASVCPSSPPPGFAGQCTTDQAGLSCS